MNERARAADTPIRQQLIVESTSDGFVRLRGAAAGPAGDAGLDTGEGVAFRTNLMGSPELTEVLIDLSLVNHDVLRSAINADPSTISTAPAGTAIAATVAPKLAHLATLHALSNSPHRCTDPRIWALDMYETARDFRWFGSNFDSWVSDLEFTSLRFIEDWMERPRIDSVAGLAILLAARSVVESIGPESPMWFMAAEIHDTLGSLEDDFVQLGRPRLLMSSPPLTGEHDVLLQRLPLTLVGPADWFSGALKSEITGNALRLALDTADQSSEGPNVLFVRISYEDESSVRWISVLQRRSGGRFESEVALPGFDARRSLSFDLVDSLRRPVLESVTAQRQYGEQWARAGWDAARAGLASTDRAKFAYRQAKQLLETCDPGISARIDPYLADPSLDAQPFLADLDDVDPESS